MSKPTEIKPYALYHEEFENALDQLIKGVKSYYPRFSSRQSKKIEKAFHFAEKSHQSQKRFSGEPYFIHIIGATEILMQIKPDIDTICACLLHDVIEDTPITAAEIELEFGPDVRFLCEGVEKVSKIRLAGKDREYETLRKIFIAMAKDIRVIFIKLADRIHNLQTLEHVRPEKQQRIAKESIEIYASIAEKLNLFEFKVQIEDLCFKHLHPEAFENITKQLEFYKTQESLKVEASKKEIAKKLKAEQIKFIQIVGRQKNAYSIYLKMKRKNFSRIDEIFDLYAMRILVPEKSDCYQVLGAIHAHWKPLTKRFKDYIAVPKPNGYQSLHTTILGLAKNNIPTEIQIKTVKMHDDAEFGPASHWIYKSVKHSNFDEDFVRKTDWFSSNFELDKPSAPEDFFKHMSESLSKNRIHVFTPRGEIKNLPEKATPIDFAYSVHSAIGDSCIGAKVNGVIKPLDYTLQGGEVIEILTKAGRRPNPAWLEFVQSNTAKSRIQNYINTHKNLEDKHEKLELEAVQKKIKKIDVIPSKMGLQQEENPLRDYNIIIGGEEGLCHRFAKCCTPNPKNPIIAYNTRGREFVIHDLECPIYKRLDAERVMEAYFIIQRKFAIHAKDRKGLMRDYSDTISKEGVFIWDIKFKRLKNNMVTWTFTINLKDEKELEEVKRKILQLENVIEIKDLKLK